MRTDQVDLPHQTQDTDRDGAADDRMVTTVVDLDQAAEDTAMIGRHDSDVPDDGDEYGLDALFDEGVDEAQDDWDDVEGDGPPAEVPAHHGSEAGAAAPGRRAALPREDAGDDQAGTVTTFSTTMLGYNKTQVDDYLDRVEMVIADADRRHAEDGARFAAYEAEISSLTDRLDTAERRAAGQPEAASLLTRRLSEMLALAEREAEEIRRTAKEDAERILADGRRRAEQDQAERLAALEARETEATAALESMDAHRIEAQNDAERLRTSSRKAAEELVAEAKEQAQQITGKAQDEAEDLTSTARREADELTSRTKSETDALVEEAAQRASQIRQQADEDVRATHDAARQEERVKLAEAQQRLDDLRAQRDGVAQEIRALTERLTAITQAASQTD